MPQQVQVQGTEILLRIIMSFAKKTMKILSFLLIKSYYCSARLYSQDRGDHNNKDSLENGKIGGTCHTHTELLLLLECDTENCAIPPEKNFMFTIILY